MQVLAKPLHTPISLQIDTLLRKECELRSHISSLEKKKGNTEECRYLQIDVERCVRKRLFLQAISKLKIGMTVTGVYRNKADRGIIRGFQEFDGRIVAVWVCWNESNTQLPEDPTLLVIERS